MSTRRAAVGGFCNPQKLPKGPNGRALCRRCSTEVPKGRVTFCSEACIDEWKVRTNPGYARSKVLARDKGVCAICRLDCEAARRRLESLKAEFRQSFYQQYSWDRICPVEGRAFFVACEELGLRKPWRGESLWQADHVVPVVEGGGECGLEGLRTLCTACHRAETAKLRKRMSLARKAKAPA